MLGNLRSKCVNNIITWIISTDSVNCQITDYIFTVKDRKEGRKEEKKQGKEEERKEGDEK
jgi:hypothetical protein